MNFSSECYLPYSEERIERLQSVIDGRPLAILLPGPSIKELEKRISELRQADICYFGIKSCSVFETNILQQIDKHLSVLMNSNVFTMALFIEDTINFLNRNENNMFISSFGRHEEIFDLLGNDFRRDKFLSEYDEKLLFFAVSYDRLVPNKNHPLHFISGNTLQGAIQLAIIGKASRIVLFGADGGAQENAKEYYHRQDQYKPELREDFNSELKTAILGHYLVDARDLSNPQDYLKGITIDTNLCFNPIMPLAIRNVYEIYNLPPIDILNCSENSLYNPFPNISYDDAFEYLITGNKVTKKADKRTPKLSVITVAMDIEGFFEETIEKVVEQSYPNFEHIIVCEGEDDKIDGMKGRCFQTKWVCEKFDGWYEGLRKGISAARGEYIYYLPPGDSFANPDWLNICMDIFENHPDISLVWGLSQELSEWNGAPGQITNSEFFHDPPPQGKDFIYYWIKKKYSFYPGSFCVRKSVFEECFPFDDSCVPGERKAWLFFNYNFNTSGYLPFFVPLVANYYRTYFDQGGHRPQGDPVLMHLPYYVPITDKEMVRETIPDKVRDRMVSEYHVRIRQYRNSILIDKVNHRFKDGFGQELEGNFRRC